METVDLLQAMPFEKLVFRPQSRGCQIPPLPQPQPQPAAVAVAVAVAAVAVAVAGGGFGPLDKVFERHGL